MSRQVELKDPYQRVRLVDVAYKEHLARYLEWFLTRDPNLRVRLVDVPVGKNFGENLWMFVVWDPNLGVRLVDVPVGKHLCEKLGIFLNLGTPIWGSDLSMSRLDNIFVKNLECFWIQGPQTGGPTYRCYEQMVNAWIDFWSWNPILRVRLIGITSSLVT